MIHSDAKGRIWIAVSNHSTGTVELQLNVPIGSVVALSEREGTLCEESEIDLQVSQLKSSYPSCLSNIYFDEWSRYKATNPLNFIWCTAVMNCESPAVFLSPQMRLSGSD